MHLDDQGPSPRFRNFLDLRRSPVPASSDDVPCDTGGRQTRPFKAEWPAYCMHQRHCSPGRAGCGASRAAMESPIKGSSWGRASSATSTGTRSILVHHCGREPRRLRLVHSPPCQGIWRLGGEVNWLRPPDAHRDALRCELFRHELDRAAAFKGARPTQKAWCLTRAYADVARTLCHRDG